MIKRNRYLVPNSLVVTRGCPHHCDFCYKDAFFQGGAGFYTQRIDDALAEIERLPGRHLYFLDDHLLGNTRFATGLFEGMQGMNRVFQGTATVDSILRGNLIVRAAEAGLRSLFVGFETLSPENLRQSNKKQHLNCNYSEAIRPLHDLGVMINTIRSNTNSSIFSTPGWKKFEPVWNVLIKTGHLNQMLPVLEAILSKVARRRPATPDPEALSMPTLP